MNKAPTLKTPRRTRTKKSNASFDQRSRKEAQARKPLPATETRRPNKGRIAILALVALSFVVSLIPVGAHAAERDRQAISAMSQVARSPIFGESHDNEVAVFSDKAIAPGKPAAALPPAAAAGATAGSSGAAAAEQDVLATEANIQDKKIASALAGPITELSREDLIAIVASARSAKQARMLLDLNPKAGTQAVASAEQPGRIRDTLAPITKLGERAAERLGVLGGDVREGASQIVITALGLIGVPYHWGGESTESGFDCSGLMRHVFESTVGLILPRTAAEQAHDQNLAKVHRNDLEPGDLVFFKTRANPFSHVGIYIGKGQFIHAPRTGAEVRVDAMDNSFWRTRFTGARRAPLKNI